MYLIAVLGVVAAAAVLGTFGRQVLGTIGTSIQVSADGRPKAKAGGVTIDWATVAAVAGADVTWLDNFIVKIGEKGLRYGQVICRITASGKFGPYDPLAADGRQTLAQGACYVINESVNSNDPRSDHPEAIEGGLIFLERVIQSGVGAHSLAAGPTLAEFQAVFPGFRYVPSLT